MSLPLLALIACTLLEPSVLDLPPEPPTRPEPAAPRALALAHHADEGRYVLPESNRPGGVAAPEAFHPAEPFRFVERRKRYVVYRTALPLHDNLLPTTSHGTHKFGSQPPPGLEVNGPDGPLGFAWRGTGPNSFGFDREHLYVGLPAGAPPPAPGDVTLRYGRATDTENGLSFGTSGLSPADFVGRTVTLGQTSHTGLYLPAPAEARFTVEVPEGGAIAFRGTLLPPAIAAEELGDGAAAVVEVEADGERTVVGRLGLRVGDFRPARFDLSRWGGRTVELVLRTDARSDGLYDHAFLEAPAIYAPDEEPERLLIVFVDTLRPDHLGLYGYDRPTTPSLDRWAEHAAVFDQARSVAPWTLPSARAALSGRQPEHWHEGDTLAERLSEAGWATEAVVSNAFLSQPFGLHRGWDRYTYDHLRPAADLVTEARRILARHADRDAAVLVHFMDPHLPYVEPWSYRGLFEEERPGALRSLSRKWLVELDRRDEDLPAIRQHVVDRYDQNVRMVDDALLTLLDEVGPEATVLVFSDHGEEFWDHDGFEHGHAFWDELLRVPLLVRSPGVPPGRHEAPVSLLDVTPTLLELAGLPPDEETPGRSLVPLMWGELGAAEALAARPQGYGRPLYGEDAWGVLAHGHKWLDRGGDQSLYAIGPDPAEELDLARGAKDLARYPEALAEALGREVHLAWRLRLFLPPPGDPVDVQITHPSGFEEVWTAYDPRGRYAAVKPERDGEVVRLRRPEGAEAPEILYLVPRGADPLRPEGLAVEVRHGERVVRAEGSDRPYHDRYRHPVVLRGLDDGLGFQVDLAWVPVPDGQAIEGFAPEMEQQLRELGYLDE